MLVEANIEGFDDGVADKGSNLGVVFDEDFIAVFTAFFVISLNVTRHGASLSIESAFAKCQLIASPSRSGSVAR